MTNVKVKANLFGLMVGSTQENGNQENSTVLAFIYQKMANKSKESGKMVKKFDGWESKMMIFSRTIE